MPLGRVVDDPLVRASPRRRRRPDGACGVAGGGRFHGDHEVLERPPVVVLAAAARVVHERGERDREHLVGAALCAQTLDEARRALREWLDL